MSGALVSAAFSFGAQQCPVICSPEVTPIVCPNPISSEELEARNKELLREVQFLNITVTHYRRTSQAERDHNSEMLGMSRNHTKYWLDKATHYSEEALRSQRTVAALCGTDQTWTLVGIIRRVFSAIFNRDVCP